jgi:uncharacterized protein (TIGR02145 family)
MFTSSLLAQNKLKDIDGNDYRIVKIGKQIWLAENLDVQKFRNADTIFLARTVDEWKQAAIDKKPACCYYEFNPKKWKKFGKLYNWYAVNDLRGLAPTGWQIASLNEIQSLSNFAGSKAGIQLKSKRNWFFDKSNPTMISLSIENKGKDTYGFNAKAGGIIDKNGNFSLVKYMGYWWTIDEYDQNTQHTEFKIGSEEDKTQRIDESKDAAIFYWMEFFSAFLDYSAAEKGNGYSVRCLKSSLK